MSKWGFYAALVIVACIWMQTNRITALDTQVVDLHNRITMLERDSQRLTHLFEQQAIINQALIERHIGPRRGDILFGVPVPAVPVTRVIGIKIKQQGVRIDAHQRPAKR